VILTHKFVLRKSLSHSTGAFFNKIIEKYYPILCLVLAHERDFQNDPIYLLLLLCTSLMENSKHHILSVSNVFTSNISFHSISKRSMAIKFLLVVTTLSKAVLASGKR
jgi:hypothetical protein